MRRVKKFFFDKAVDSLFVEKEVIKSILTTEKVFGPSKVKSSVKYCVADNKAVFYVFNDIGSHVFEVFRRRIDLAVGRGRYSLKEN